MLVIIQLDGGNDGINTVVPFRDEGYAKYRQGIRIATDRLLKVSDGVGLHPAMGGAAKLLESGRLAIVQGVGYPNPDRSHFASMAIWQTARFDPAEHSGLGWLGRGLDVDSAAAGQSGAIYVGAGAPPVALRGRRSATTALEGLNDLRLDVAGEARGASSSGGNDGDEVAAFVRRSQLDAYTTADRMAELVRSSKQDGFYPDTAASKKLALVAQLLKGGFAARVFYATQPGYDTHNAQGRFMGRSCRSSRATCSLFLTTWAGQTGGSRGGSVFQRVWPKGGRERLGGHRSRDRGSRFSGGAGGQGRAGRIHAQPVRPCGRRRQDVDRLSAGVCVGARGVAWRAVSGGAGGLVRGCRSFGFWRSSSITAQVLTWSRGPTTIFSSSGLRSALECVVEWAFCFGGIALNRLCIRERGRRHAKCHVSCSGPFELGGAGTARGRCAIGPPNRWPASSRAALRTCRDIPCAKAN